MITLEKYKSYFMEDNGDFVQDAPPCINCTEEKFRKCLSLNEGCGAFNEKAKKRGWKKSIKGFDY